MPKPISRRVEKRGRNRGIVDALKQTETANVCSMERVVVRVVARHDPPNGFAAGAREKERRVAVLEKRVPGTIDKLLSLEQKRRNPGRIVFINLPRKFNEGSPLLA